MADQLTLTGLCIRAGERHLVEGVGLQVEAGQIVALVGASGSGKTLTARSLLGLPGPRPGVTSAQLRLRVGERCFEPYAALTGTRPTRRQLRVVERAFRRIRGSVVGYLPQDARGALDPLWPVGRQVQEAIDLSGATGGAEGPLDWLGRAGFDTPEEIAPLYPHQLSGGMAQRVCIALTMARGSHFVIADEPTTGLDPTVQEEILRELARTAAAGVGVLLITHDLRLVTRLAASLLIMHEGRIVEQQEGRSLDEVASPEGRALLEATARIGGRVGGGWA